jgi:hypothetical protein
MNDLQPKNLFHFPVEPVFFVYEQVAQNKVCPTIDDILTHYHNVVAYRASHRLSPAYQVSKNASLEDVIEMKPTLDIDDLTRVLYAFRYFHMEYKDVQGTLLRYFHNIPAGEVW